MHPNVPLRPSSGSSGFFQQPPHINNQYEDDAVFRTILHCHSQSPLQLATELSDWGQRVVQPDIFELIDEAEKHPPTVSTHTTFGRPRTSLHTSHGWQELQRLGIAAGVVAIPYEEANCSARLRQFMKIHLWTGSAAMVMCPSSMTDGAASLLRSHLSGTKLNEQQRSVFTEAYRRLTSRDPSEAWTSGQWMTERSGGSDVRNTETVATFVGHDASGKDAHGMPLGPWSINGFKWFSSATDSQMAVLLAQTEEGLSAFYAPMRRTSTDGKGVEMNGVSIQRLKPKLGTRALPTAELVLDGMRAYLIGQEGEGVKEISAILNITRVHTAIGALGYWGRGLAISRAYARVRKVQGALLENNIAYVHALAENSLQYAAHMHFGFFTVLLLGIVEEPRSFQDSTKGVSASTRLVSSITQAQALLRLLTPIAKCKCSRAAASGLQECMESLGGVGFLEDEQEFNVARLWRDNFANVIWEGTTEVMAADIVRVLKGKDGEKTQSAFFAWISERLDVCRDTPNKLEGLDGIVHAINAQKTELQEKWLCLSAEELRYHGRQLMEALFRVVAGVLLLDNALMGNRDESGQTEEVKIELANRWLNSRNASAPLDRKLHAQNAALDREIAFGSSPSSPGLPKHKSML
ncbi:hypothetical protein KC340_g8958 [Hortaea werneckii]|nr:hypothetical protein KC342_g2473 [Hortaea werneckii]KAI7099395.1 hypothetical protein KC339_g8234 [Hortaea werneckii]KAI7244655.1 hypothetical protein KC365_g1229 [Hortaea werneckii]KAI7315559.1 hypothetical protein KC340_g8958 [Hortaea werneckii]KAI7379404.1 hypothetical protein KC328_g13367 [Hortaea werneckii]